MYGTGKERQGGQKQAPSGTNKDDAIQFVKGRLWDAQEKKARLQRVDEHRREMAASRERWRAQRNALQDAISEIQEQAAGGVECLGARRGRCMPFVPF